MAVSQGERALQHTHSAAPATMSACVDCHGAMAACSCVPGRVRVRGRRRDLGFGLGVGLGWGLGLGLGLGLGQQRAREAELLLLRALEDLEHSGGEDGAAAEAEAERLELHIGHRGDAYPRDDLVRVGGRVGGRGGGRVGGRVGVAEELTSSSETLTLPLVVTL
jgi:hypothetical protein